MTSSPRPANSPTTTPSHPAHTLLARAHSPDTASRIFGDKIKNKPLLLNPTASADRDKRALRRHVRLRKQEYYLRKRKPRPLSAKEKRELGVFELKKEEVSYRLYEGLHRMWVDYMLEVLGYMKDGQVVQQSLRKTVTPQGGGPLLASADFHGAQLEVVRCADAGRVGTSGIVIRDTKFTFVLVTAKDEVRVVPKKNTVFRYEIPLPEVAGEVREGGERQGRSLVFELHGNQFEFRPADRANRKFKWKVTDYL
ncbi:ribonuclease P protein subunit POP4 [Cladophialophora yegresii CBS 114405]|uniref:Ribonuclease P protein subunit n=1 Tax=Cladophialophora yegresii CBS 114405 TaxID=1182544 RepID=W9VJL2_9EURO|nr:ribonuclease P protein subunit POP4 [Cladophialophora yegresii CBS 114405]EXJ55842.1 ribonuclease P protein subunit POP4 [Cladophialophora yegresii CBS 114405]